VYAAAGPARAAARSATRGAGHGLRPAGRRSAGSLHDQPGGAEPLGRGCRGTAARLPGGRRAMAGPRVGPGHRVRCTPVGRRVGRGRLCVPPTGRRKRGEGPAGARGRGSGGRRRTSPAAVGGRGAAGRPRRRPHHRRDGRQPAGAARAAARPQSSRAGGRLRAVRPGSVVSAHRADLCSPGGTDAREHAAAAPARGRRSDRRSRASLRGRRSHGPERS
jgi:hypothetical protein